MNIRCAECQCIPEYCDKNYTKSCKFCIKNICCCGTIHKGKFQSNKKTTFSVIDDCCSNDACKNNIHEKPIQQNQSRIKTLFKNIKKIYAAALGIEILCISFASIGENIGLYIFGFNHSGI
jgi:hypothetical protein